MKQFFTLLTVTLLIASCSSYKNIPYFQDIPKEGISYADTTFTPPEIKICVGDVLTITVATLDSKAALPYNLPIISYATQGGSEQRSDATTSSSDQMSSPPALQTYTVDKEGNINFPVLGTLHILGLTKIGLINFLKEKMATQLKDPVITVHFINFQVSILGEVNKPGNYTISNEQVTIMQALAIAGDMTPYGVRNNVLLVRNIDGKQKYIRLDFNKKDLLTSPYYYLQQNDVIYVEPNKSRMTNIDTQSASIYISIFSTLITTVAVIYSIIKK